MTTIDSSPSPLPPPPFLAPYGLAGIGIAYAGMRLLKAAGHPLLPGPRLLWVLAMDVPVGVSLLVVSSGYNKVSALGWGLG